MERSRAFLMLNDPRVGDTYRQEFHRGKAEDMGTVVAVGKRLQPFLKVLFSKIVCRYGIGAASSERQRAQISLRGGWRHGSRGKGRRATEACQLLDQLLSQASRDQRKAGQPARTAFPLLPAMIAIVAAMAGFSIERSSRMNKSLLFAAGLRCCHLPLLAKGRRARRLLSTKSALPTIRTSIPLISRT